jgi:hypothetical protein
VTVAARDTDWLAEFPSEDAVPAAAETPADDALDSFPAETPEPRVMTPNHGVAHVASAPRPSGTLASHFRATLARFVFGA